MGVAPRMQETFTYKEGICRKTSKTLENVTVRCHFKNGEVDSEIVLNKTLSKAPAWAISRMKERRQTCDTCPAPPVWTNQSGDKPLPKGALFFRACVIISLF